MRRPVKALVATVALIAGGAAVLIAQTSTAQAVTGNVDWKVDCNYSHQAKDDPIVLPGQPGASHLHDFWGNISTNAYSTYSSMEGVTSTCTHNDRAAYWAPALYRDGVLQQPNGSIVYYTVTAYKEPKIEAFPKNFMMVVGNKNDTTAAEVSNHIYWGCSDDTQIGYQRRQPPADCRGHYGIQFRVEFPSCWDGVTVNGDESAHMRYPSGGNCPAGYPHVFPRIGFHVGWGLGNQTTGTITFSSGNVYSEHMDFWNTWDQPTLQTLINDCANGQDRALCGHFKGSEGSPGKPAPAVDTSHSNANPPAGNPGAGTTPPTSSDPTTTTAPPTTAPPTTAPPTTAPPTTAPPTTAPPTTAPPTTAPPTTAPPSTSDPIPTSTPTWGHHPSPGGGSGGWPHLHCHAVAV